MALLWVAYAPLSYCCWGKGEYDKDSSFDVIAYLLMAFILLMEIKHFKKERNLMITTANRSHARRWTKNKGAGDYQLFSSPG
jgi:hypothetical protein